MSIYHVHMKDFTQTSKFSKHTAYFLVFIA